MPKEFVSANVVVAARQFNPSVFSQLWMVRTGVLNEEDFRENCLFSDAAVNVESRQFALFVVPPQLQFVPKVEPREQQELGIAVVGRIVQAIPHTPYVAIGLNFIWDVWPEQEDMRAACERLFPALHSPLFEDFKSTDARYGAYFSKDFFHCRLRLSIKPSRATEHEKWRFAFNFNLDLAQKPRPVEEIISQLEQWNHAAAECATILEHTGIH